MKKYRIPRSWSSRPVAPPVKGKQRYVIDGRHWSVHEKIDGFGNLLLMIRLLEPRPPWAHWEFTGYGPAVRTSIDPEWLPKLGIIPAMASPWERRCAREAGRRYWIQSRGLQRSCSIQHGGINE